MLTSTWTASASQTLKRLRNRNHEPLRICIIGVGQELNGDDAAGTRLAQQILFQIENYEQARTTPAQKVFDSAVLIAIPTGPAPENYTHRIRKFHPHIVILADAAQMDAEPGTIRWIGVDEIGQVTPSTHTLPLNLLAEYLTAELGCEVWLWVIQPERNEVGAEMSDAVRRGVNEGTSWWRGINRNANQVLGVISPDCGDQAPD